MIWIAALLVPLALTLHLVYWSVKNGIGPMPSSPGQARAILDAIAQPVDGARIYDLGSGFGTLALLMAAHFPQCRVAGVESSPLPYFVSRLLLAFSGKRGNLQFQKADCLKIDLSEVDIAVCYLFPAGMQRLKGRLQAHMRPGTLVVSSCFAVNGWVPERVVKASDLFASTVYCYRMQ